MWQCLHVHACMYMCPCVSVYVWVCVCKRGDRGSGRGARKKLQHQLISFDFSSFSSCSVFYRPLGRCRNLPRILSLFCRVTRRAREMRKCMWSFACHSALHSYRFQHYRAKKCEHYCPGRVRLCFGNHRQNLFECTSVQKTRAVRDVCGRQMGPFPPIDLDSSRVGFAHKTTQEKAREETNSTQNHSGLRTKLMLSQ